MCRGIRGAAAPLILSAAFAVANAGMLDTLIVGDGSPGPYLLGDRYLDTAGMEARYADTGRGMVTPFVYIGTVNGILFSAPLDSGTVVRVICRTQFLGVRKVFSLYPKTYLDAADTAAVSSLSLRRPVLQPAATENLVISGYKSVGVSIGSQGQMNVQQALDITAFGEVGPETEISAHISDAGTTLEASTREISDLDLVYITLKNPRYAVTVGDQYVKWPAGSIFAANKKIKGISAAFTTKPLAAGAFGAMAGGKFTLQTITGRNGLQGPYRLLGGGETEIITPIKGTLRLTADGVALKEGDEGDFTVDYDLGTITFTTRFAVTDDRIIRAEYEYKTFEYQRYMVGTDLKAAAGDSVLQVTGALWNEFDNRNQPIDLELSGDDITLMGASGDASLIKPSGRVVDPKRVSIQDAYEPLYRIDSAGTPPRYVYRAFMPQRPDDNTGFYSVTFTPVGPGKGEYRDTVIVDTLQRRRRVYLWAGAGMGTATALAPLPLPRRTVTGEIRARARPSQWVDAEIGVAGQNHDANLFSSQDDDDNNGAASDVSLTLGNRDFRVPGVWVGAAHKLSTRQFTKEIITPFERHTQWDDRSADTAKGRRQAWNGSAGGSFGPGLSLEGGYGQLWLDSARLTDHILGSVSAAPGDRWSAQYRGNWYFHRSPARRGRTRTDDLAQTLSLRRTRLSLRLFDEWRTMITDTGRGRLGAEAGVSFSPISLEESVMLYSGRTGAGEIFSARDTGYMLQWRQSASGSPVLGWRLAGNSSFMRNNVYGTGVATTVLGTVSSDLGFTGSPFATRQEYSVSSQRASSYVQVPLYAGEGLGDFSRDTAASQYIPTRGGNYYLQQQEVYDNTSDRRMRKTRFDGSWSFNPHTLNVPGLLGDLAWYGTLSTNEQIAADSGVTNRSWIPGYMIVAGRVADSVVPSANLSYRQTLAWSPESLPDYRGEVRAEPAIKRQTGYQEKIMRLNAELEWNKGAWNLRAEGEGNWVDHKGIARFSNDYQVRDRSLTLTEKYLFGFDIRGYVQETGGWAQKKSSMSNDDGWYLLLKPGVSWQPVEKGWAEVSYTFSRVLVPGADLDYRMAKGFASGTLHTIDAYADVKMGMHFNLSASYRGEFTENGRSTHVMTMEIKAML